MKRLQFRKLVAVLLDRIDRYHYNGGMKTKITPRVYEAIKTEYDEASRTRREEIRRLAREGWTQKEIADYYGIDVSRVNKIIKGSEEA